MRLIPTAIILVPLLAAFSFAHGPETEEIKEAISIPFDPSSLLIIASSLTFILIAISITMRNSLPENAKKSFFIIIVIAVSISTLYLAGATVLLNVSSVAGGPVHWHADYEIWTCGQKALLPEPKNIENRVGTGTLHHHNEGAESSRHGIYRIHIEGVVTDPEEVNLGHFFEAIGGQFTHNSISIPQKDGSIMEYKNGDLCPDGIKGELRMYVNGELNGKMDEYVIKPYPNVPPGDFIRIVFGSLPENIHEGGG
ncbi:MAG: hypothetical protein HYX24_06940 [Candidatus Aenigmarchaeota archaeon]|nr:hypothetical protein [Candidatus Aenigmarchaeota archaeon]